MIDQNKTEDPAQIANLFAAKYNNAGYQFDFSMKSLLVEMDKILEANSNHSLENREILVAELTAYFGETICQLHLGKWEGAFYGPLNPNGVNFYTCKIKVGDSEFGPSHFFEYYVSNGKKSEGTFKNYLQTSEKLVGILKNN